ncbi:hypothetical protein Gbem_2862 [Citrifermentans bemidjiense Bem]|uniref:Secreted protein n=1 Tax=Citrifermentans bemidjiense (strain ATCC BAA-1014 / DSM 16622 / JCM 12645 / Bem) TaxID=404380 RepID=B5EIG4_CITBB|nr:hypothetical protein [Citrifermentans bemidjiense]ACH39866.1 hypothetical protein Gbem_2862 [Citrifermentans bemidjiense Bem]
MRPCSLLFGIATFALSSASPAFALIGLNQCGPGTKPPVRMHCGQEELLLGYRDAAGPCLWVCCPPNSDGRTYDCSGDPTPSDFKLDLRNVRPRPWTGVFTPGSSFLRPDAEKDTEGGMVQPAK